MHTRIYVEVPKACCQCARTCVIDGWRVCVCAAKQCVRFLEEHIYILRMCHDMRVLVDRKRAIARAHAPNTPSRSGGSSRIIRQTLSKRGAFKYVSRLGGAVYVSSASSYLLVFFFRRRIIV